MNVLITSASRKVSLVSAFQQAVRPLGGRVIAADITPLAAALYKADAHALLPRSDAPEFRAALLELCRAHEIRLLIPTRDAELPLLAGWRAEFARAGVTIMIAEPETIATCLDKQRFVEACRRHGFATPRVYDWRAVTAADLPLFVKPRTGASGLGARAVHTIAELDALAAQSDQLLLQEYVRATEYTCDVFCDFESNVISVVPRERLVVIGGESFVGRTVRDQRIIEQTAALARALRLVGHNTVQCFSDGDAVKFIEVNPRYGGAANLGFAAGARTPAYLVEAVLHGRVAARLGDFEDGLYMLRYTEDVFVRPNTAAPANAYTQVHA